MTLDSINWQRIRQIRPLKSVPYVGIQFVAIPEFAGMATEVSQEFSAAYAGQQSVEEALEKAQAITNEVDGSSWLQVSLASTPIPGAVLDVAPGVSKRTSEQKSLIVAQDGPACPRSVNRGDVHPNGNSRHSRSAARLMMAPAVVLLLGWMLVPLIMTLWFSFRNYLPLRGDSLANGLELGRVSTITFVSSVIQRLLARGSDHADHACWAASSIITVGTRCIFLAHAAGSTDMGTGRRPHPRHCPLLRDADRVRAGVEEHVHGSR